MRLTVSSGTSGLRVLLILFAATGPSHAQTAEALTGRWGLAAYFRPVDAPRVATAAMASCNAPYIIARGPGGGIMLHQPDQPRTSEHVIRIGAGGRTYIGPAGDDSTAKDREVLSWDGRQLVLRWLDDGVAGRYGTMVFMRCR